MALFARSQAPGTAPSGSLPDAPSSALAYTPPSMREMRAQAVHRLQVGMFGLAGMLLLVSLANVIMDRAKFIDQTAVEGATPAAAASAAAASDPLVDMGVAPELPVKPTVSISPAPPPRPAPSVKAPQP